MAVIRAKRLWLMDSLGPTVGAVPVTEVDEHGLIEERASTTLYTVPAGKRAILRHASFTLTATPAGGAEPTMNLKLRDAVTNKNLIVYWFWFVEHGSNIAVWRLWTGWNGQLVMHAGDIISLSHTFAGTLHTSGSGHELNELAS